MKRRLWYDTEKGEAKTMCEVLDRIENRGIAIGEERGERRGEERGEYKVLCELIHNGILSMEAAVTQKKMSVDEFLKKLRNWA